MAEKADGPIPAWQVFYDNIWLLLILGVVLPTVVYTVWGLIEIAMVPQLPVAP
ncbi:MAG: hypothetical protein H3C68_03475 [Deltaproteobacteria bacterium]|nr:hypothetical protein [Deltaproteobacteria bacterium]MBZ0219786.1 hypothetical protein [Deltaproteobacteria bacterium]